MGLLSFGLVNGRPVFMDGEQDAYFIAEPGEPRLAGQAPLAWPMPRRSLPDEVSPASMPLLGDLAATARLLLRARRSIARRRFADVLAELDELESAATLADGAGEALEAAARFLWARRLFPQARNCLTDSLALMHFLARADCCAALVFGVKLDPFAAHCWVQAGEWLLNDHLERVERFTPVGTVPCLRVTQ